jgi:glycosyltransferase involved in cell wall biosynthesis
LTTKVSIVIPTLNAGPEFEELLEKVCVQEGDFEHEAIVVDSGSTDGTVELARRYGARVHQIRVPVKAVGGLEALHIHNTLLSNRRIRLDRLRRTIRCRSSRTARPLGRSES